MNAMLVKVEKIEVPEDQNYFYEAIKRLVGDTSLGCEEITMSLSIPELRQFQQTMEGKYVDPVSPIKTICDTPIWEVDGFEYSFLGVRVNVFGNTSENMGELKKCVPQIVEQFDSFGGDSAMLDTSPTTSNKRYDSRAGFIFKERLGGDLHELREERPSDIPQETLDKWEKEENEFPGIKEQKEKFYKDFSEKEMLIFAMGYKLGQEQLKGSTNEGKNQNSND